MNSDRTIVRREALRALAEGAPPTFDILADATGRSVEAIERLAEREGWKSCSRHAGDDFRQRIRPIVAKLLDKVESISSKATEEGGTIDRTEIDGVLAMIRAIEKIADFDGGDEGPVRNQTIADEDMATVLTRLNGRIVDLASELAARMAAERTGIPERPARI
ncbi:hypothetical protein [Mesorhizobium sp. CAU 1741]|uniref:hypothetical protein n=1 Tax=Mesorhizobium sp. CAU 1741 TaxID=3140366 RepID=UPI00325B085C